MKYEEVDGKTYRIPNESVDVDDAMLALAEEICDGWFSDDERIDWEEFIDRLSTYSRLADDPWELDEYVNPAVEKIKRHIRDYRRVL